MTAQAPSRTVLSANVFLHGKELSFADANRLWQQLKGDDEISLARRVVAHIRGRRGLRGEIPADEAIKHRLCQQHALLTSKDVELDVGRRHDDALHILREEFATELEDPEYKDAETLGIAGGICKRRWADLGRLEDLHQAAVFYQRAAVGPVGEDGYTQINAAFVLDVLSHTTAGKAEFRAQAAKLRTQVQEELPTLEDVKADKQWWNAASRAEALFGLGCIRDATAAIQAVNNPPAVWQRSTTAEQLGRLAYLHYQRPFEREDIRAFFDALLPGAPYAAQSAVIGKVGLALSGGGFRASFYHLGVLARLAELDVLRHVDVLSCVSGGSIVGMCYWLQLRKRLMEQDALTHGDYIDLVQEVIAQFTEGVEQDLRTAMQVSKLRAVWNFWNNEKGAVETDKVVDALTRQFYQRFFPGRERIDMHDLVFQPKSHDAALSGSETFHPGKHNWLRHDHVPALIVNATTVNTGHAWQCTPTWMGESPCAIHAAADSVPRLEWHWYVPEKGWRISVGEAVAASACVPGLFAPVRLNDLYDGVQVQLVDGGVHDNQGTVSLLAQNCDVLLVSDAAGQLVLEEGPRDGLTGLGAYALRANDTLMERIRLANYADLAARVRTQQIKGLMFLHMKDGLDASPIRLTFSQAPEDIHRKPLSPHGVRKDIQQGVAELRTDLDVFSPTERNALMACGYTMAASAFARDLGHVEALSRDPLDVAWPFDDMRAEVESTDAATPNRDRILAELRKGKERTSAPWLGG